LVTLTAPAFNLRRQAFAYMAEVVRSGIDAVAKSQWEAAASLGLCYFRIIASWCCRRRSDHDPADDRRLCEHDLSNCWGREWRSASPTPGAARPVS